MKLKTKAWLVSQGLLIITALIIQLTIFRAIKVGPILGMPKRSYVEIILGDEPVVPESILSKNLPPEAYDARLPFQKSRFVNPIFPCIVVLLSRKRDFGQRLSGESL